MGEKTVKEIKGKPAKEEDLEALEKKIADAEEEADKAEKKMKEEA